MKYCPLCKSLLTNKVIDGIERLACSSEPCTYVFYDNPVPVVAAIVECGGRIVLARKRGWPESMFGIVAGFLEKGETPDQAVLREVEEELGLKGKINEFIGYYSFFMTNQLILAYHVKTQGTITIGSELDAVKLVLPEEITPWPHGTGPAVKDWLERRKSRSITD
jgi:NADH pyrophosphatase NudC (nudix superfamily)